MCACDILILAVRDLAIGYLIFRSRSWSHDRDHDRDCSYVAIFSGQHFRSCSQGRKMALPEALNPIMLDIALPFLLNSKVTWRWTFVSLATSHTRDSFSAGQPQAPPQRHEQDTPYGPSQDERIKIAKAQRSKPSDLVCIYTYIYIIYTHTTRACLEKLGY